MTPDFLMPAFRHAANLAVIVTVLLVATVASAEQSAASPPPPATEDSLARIRAEQPRIVRYVLGIPYPAEYARDTRRDWDRG